MADKKRHNYEYDIDIRSDVAPARVLRMVTPGSKVLEIGAGPGSITRMLSGKLKCDVVALEIDPSALEKLKPFARSVYAMDLNDPTWVEQLIKDEGKFDFVIAADVLEHVLNASGVLGGMKELLNETGSIILSLPHATHAAVGACMIDEDIEYRDWGLLDRTHLNWFGVKNVQELYASQGLAIEHAEFVVRTPEMTEFVHRWNRMSPAIKAALQRNKFSHVYQVVSRAVPVERAKENIRLMDLPVTPADAKTTKFWEDTMASLPVTPGLDHQPTFDMTDVSSTNATKDISLIAFYLTQFHPIPENDEWWGKGFTEWTNSSKARPLFEGHYQPHIPADMGYYDLRMRETRHQQIEMAKSYGIEGFCYYYYWFSGKRLLEQPLEDMLNDPQSDMPFCLCWANENWTRRWDAAEHEILIAQKYRPEDDLEFIKDLMPYLQDPRYIRHNGAPFIIVYRPQHLPDVKKTLDVWRDYCAANGIGDIHLACAYTHSNWDHKQYGFDSGVEFPPHNVTVPNRASGMKFHDRFDGMTMEYADVAEQYLANDYSDANSGFRSVFPSWDNTARRGPISSVVMNGTPENYEYWLSRAIAKTKEEFPDQQRFIFINAWNEWAEGAHLEPDLKYGHQFLEATLRAKGGSTPARWPNAPTSVGVRPGQNDIPKHLQKGLASRTWKKIKTKIRKRRA